MNLIRAGSYTIVPEHIHFRVTGQPIANLRSIQLNRKSTKLSALPFQRKGVASIWMPLVPDLKRSGRKKSSLWNCASGLSTVAGISGTIDLRNAIVAGGAEAVSNPFPPIVARLARVHTSMRVPKSISCRNGSTEYLTLVALGAKLKIITAWVQEHFPTPDEMRTFVQRVPTAIIVLIVRGVANFGNGKKEEMVL
jgi:hypothetical protein